MDVHPDFRVLGFTLLVSVLVGLVSGLAPAFAGVKIELVSALKEASGSSAGASRRGWATLGNGLVVIQMALAMLVLAGAGLLVRTLANLKAVDLGFDPHNLVTFGVDTTFSSRDGEDLKGLGSELQEQLAALPGVTSATYSMYGSLRGSNMEIGISDQTKSLVSAHWLPVAPDFFRTMRISLLAGRALTPRIRGFRRSLNTEQHCVFLEHCFYPAVVINESFARLVFGGSRILLASIFPSMRCSV